MRFFYFLAYLGVDKDKESLESRAKKLCNQVNVFIAFLMILVFIFLRIMGRIEGEPMGVGSFRVLLIIAVAALNLLFSGLHQTSISRISTIFIIPFLLLLLPTILGFIEPESFTYYPILVIALSVLPHLLIIPNRNKLLYYSSLTYFVILVLFIDRFLLHFLNEPLVIVDEIESFYPYYKMGQIGGFVFIHLSVMYLRRMNTNYEYSLEESNNELKISSNVLLNKNKALDEAKKDLEESNEELVAVQERIQSQNEQLKITLTELKSTHERLVRAEKLAALGTLTAGIAHEINNPLNFIAGGASLLESEMDYIMQKDIDEITNKDSLNLIEIVKTSIPMIKSGISKASAIVKSLGVYSYAGETDLKPADIHKIIDSSLVFLKAKIGNNIQISKTYELSSKIPVHINKMHQVFLNVLDNSIYAVKQSSSKGSIFIKTHTEFLGGKSYAKISIENTGNTIPQDVLKNIFDPFYTTKDVGEGSGLGLSISQSLIKEHKGEIQLMNTNKGVSYMIRLPLEPQ